MSSILLQYSKIENFTKNFFSKKLHTQKNGPSGGHFALKGGHFRNCQHFCRSSGGFVAKHQKLKEGKIFIFGKNLTVPKKTERGPFDIFQHPFCRKTAKKLKGDPLRKKNSGKSLAVPKKMEGGMVCYAGKQEKPFWFSSLDQIVQFGPIIFCRTFVELFWSVRVD